MTVLLRAHEQDNYAITKAFFGWKLYHCLVCLTPLYVTAGAGEPRPTLLSELAWAAAPPRLPAGRDQRWGGDLAARAGGRRAGGEGLRGLTPRERLCPGAAPAPSRAACCHLVGRHPRHPPPARRREKVAVGGAVVVSLRIPSAPLRRYRGVCAMVARTLLHLRSHTTRDLARRGSWAPCMSWCQSELTRQAPLLA